MNLFSFIYMDMGLYMSLCAGLLYIFLLLKLYAPCLPEGRRICWYSIIIAIWLIILYTLLSCKVTFCGGVEDLPVIVEIKDLHLTQSLQEARMSLKGASGIYSLMHNDTGTMYIGSSVDLWNRLYAHIMDYSSNIHLQRAIIKFGLAAFTYTVIEQCARDQLREREQYWLDWLFSSNENLRYNFSPIAGSPSGYTHTEEAKAKISTGNTGKVHPKSDATKQLLSEIRGGSRVYIYDCLNSELLSSEPSLRAAARSCSCDGSTVRRYLDTGRAFNGYIFRSSLID